VKNVRRETSRTFRKRECLKEKSMNLNETVKTKQTLKIKDLYRHKNEFTEGCQIWNYASREL